MCSNNFFILIIIINLSIINSCVYILGGLKREILLEKLQKYELDLISQKDAKGGHSGFPPLAPGPQDAPFPYPCRRKRPRTVSVSGTNKRKAVISSSVSKRDYSEADRKTNVTQDYYSNPIDQNVEKCATPLDLSSLGSLHLFQWYRKSDYPFKMSGSQTADRSWYGAIVDQVVLHGIMGVPMTPGKMREAVCRALLTRPERESWTKNHFGGSAVKFLAFVKKHQRNGVVNKKGLICMVTALFLNRKISVVGVARDSKELSRDFFGEGEDNGRTLRVGYDAFRQFYSLERDVFSPVNSNIGYPVPIPAPNEVGSSESVVNTTTANSGEADSPGYDPSEALESVSGFPDAVGYIADPHITEEPLAEIPPNTIPSVLPTIGCPKRLSEPSPLKGVFESPALVDIGEPDVSGKIIQPKPTNVELHPKLTRSICAYLEEGFCMFKRSTCVNLHPERVCDDYNLNGRCASGSRCLDIHPRRICSQFRHCEKVGVCLFQHPSASLVGGNPPVLPGGQDKKSAQQRQGKGFQSRRRRRRRRK